MNTSKQEKAQTTGNKPPAGKQMMFTIDGCSVKLNFAEAPDSSAISDVKRMMLSGNARL